ncbi:lipid asymmetry maintenance protein MlaB [Leeia sp.]|uniref:STAS domain-containing protein n=1 Tax=Leeia sp. TaxID=2884678 RepID=UPI0035B4BCDF
MLKREGQILFLPERVTLSTVTALGSAFAEALRHNQDALVLDCAQVTEVDSSAVSLLLHAHRLANEARTTLTIAHIPSNLAQLISLYHLPDLRHSPQPGPSD